MHPSLRAPLPFAGAASALALALLAPAAQAASPV
jgi:hypothetical protein